jgi:hypothetical protein
MPQTFPLPPAVAEDFRREAERRGLSAEAYTRLVVETLADAFAAHPPDDEHDALLVISRLENELPRAWAEADEKTRSETTVLLLSLWMTAHRGGWRAFGEALRSVREKSRPSLHSEEADRRAIQAAKDELMAKGIGYVYLKEDGRIIRRLPDGTEEPIVS